MIKGILKTLAWKKLDNYFNASNRKARIHNLSSAKSVGVLWYLDDKKSAEIYEGFRKKLKKEGLNVFGMAFIGGSRDKEIFEKVTTSKVFNKSDVGVWGEPTSDFVVQFMRRNFDILVDLSIKDLISIKYIVAHSNAAFKIGWSWPDKNYNDFSIETTEIPEGGYLSEQLLYYLDKIKIKDKQ